MKFYLKIKIPKVYIKFERTFSNSIEKRNSCDVKTQLALSSGYDSSLILNFIKKNIKFKFLIELSIGFNNQSNETLIAKKISDSLNSRIQSINLKNLKLSSLEEIIKYYDAPLEHPSSIGIDVICKEAKKIDKVLITGEGADDLFFGYEHYKKELKNSFAFRCFLNKKILSKILSNQKNLEVFNNINTKNNISRLRKKALSSNFYLEKWKSRLICKRY